MAAVLTAFERVERINARLVPDAQELLTPGAAMAGMSVTGRGCAHRLLSLTPQFCANPPLERWFREGLRAELWNRFPRGRTRDEASTDGCDLWLHALALVVCAHEGRDLRCKHLDTTRGALPGEYVPDRAEQAMPLP
jgi:hypothetical protein